MKMTNEQIEKIIDGAPEGATHYASCVGDYLDYDVDTVFIGGKWHECNIDAYAEPHDLSDLREILTLRQDVERLKAQQSEVAARAVAEACNQSCSVIANVEREGVVNSREGVYCDVWLSSSDLMRYANQLREQSNV